MSEAGNYVTVRISHGSGSSRTTDFYIIFDGRLVRAFYGEGNIQSAITSVSGCGDQLRVKPPNARSFVRVFVDGEMTREVEGATATNFADNTGYFYPQGYGEPDMLGQPRSNRYAMIRDPNQQRLLLWYEDDFKEEITETPYGHNGSVYNNYLVLGAVDYTNNLGWSQAWYFGQKIFSRAGNSEAYYGRDTFVGSQSPYFNVCVLSPHGNNRSAGNVIVLIDGVPTIILSTDGSLSMTEGPLVRNGFGSFEFFYLAKDESNETRTYKVAFRYGEGLIYHGLAYFDIYANNFAIKPYGYKYAIRCTGEILDENNIAIGYTYEISYDGTPLLTWSTTGDESYYIDYTGDGDDAAGTSSIDVRPDFDVIVVRGTKNGTAVTKAYVNGRDLGTSNARTGGRYIVAADKTYWNGNETEFANLRSGGAGYSNDTAAGNANGSEGSPLFVQGEKVAEGFDRAAYQTFHLAKHSAVQYADGRVSIFFEKTLINTWQSSVTLNGEGGGVTDPPYLVGVGCALFFPNGRSATGQDRRVVILIGNKAVWSGVYIDFVKTGNYAGAGTETDPVNNYLYKRFYIQDTEGTVLVADAAGLMRFNSRFQRLAV